MYILKLLVVYPMILSILVVWVKSLQIFCSWPSVLAFVSRRFWRLRRCWNNSCCNHIRSYRIISSRIINELFTFNLNLQTLCGCRGGLPLDCHGLASSFRSQVPITKNQEATIMEEGEFYAIEPCPNSCHGGWNGKFQVQWPCWCETQETFASNGVDLNEGRERLWEWKGGN